MAFAFKTLTSKVLSVVMFLTDYVEPLVDGLGALEYPHFPVMIGYGCHCSSTTYSLIAPARDAR